MDRLLFLLCCIVLAATPAQGRESNRVPEKPGARKDDATTRPAPRRDRENASTGASAPERRGGTDLGFEAEKEEEAFLKKKRTAPLKGR